MRVCMIFAFMVALANSAPTEDRMISPFASRTVLPEAVVAVDAAASASADAAVDGAAAAASASVSASPILVKKASGGKRIEIQITKEVGGHHEVQAGALTATAAAAAAINGDVEITTPAPPPPAPHHHHHHHHHHLKAAVVPPAILHVDNDAIVVDNQTISDVLQKLLAGNIQNFQSQGRPLALPANGKPVAVIYSAAMHVVDLGELKPAPPVAAALDITKNIVKNITLTKHASINHTSLLHSLMAPLISLTHIGAPEALPLPVAAPVALPAAPVAPMQMQPVVVMLPMGQVGATAHVDTAAQLNAALQSLLDAKAQLLAHPGHLAHHVAVEAPVVAEAEVALNAIPAPAITKKKTVDISISKTKEVVV